MWPRRLGGVARTLKKLRWPIGITALGYLVLAYLPIFPHQAECMVSPWNPKMVFGPLSRDYRIALTENLALYERDFEVVGDWVFLRFYDWLDLEDWVLNASGKAIEKVVAQRARRDLRLSGGGTYRDLLQKMEEVSGLEEDCSVVRAVAIKHPADP